MTSASRKYSEVLVHEFYTAYKGELQSLYPQGQLWKGGKLIALLMIRGVWVDIYPCIIERFLYRPEYQAPINTRGMDYRMDNMKKITN